MLISIHHHIFFILTISLSSVTALRISFSREPKDVIVGPGQTATFDCVAAPEISASVKAIEWLKDDKALRLDTRRRLLTNGSLVITRVRKLRLKSGTAADEGRYRCRLRLVDDGGALVSREARLQVAYLAEVFDVEPLDATGRLGESVSFHCNLKSAPQPLPVSWLFSKSSASSMLLPMPLSPAPGRFVMHDHGRVLEVSSLTKEQLGSYFCRVALPKAVHGNTKEQDRFRISRKAVLKLRSGDRGKAPIPLTFELSPMDVEVAEGGTAELLCSANGRTAPSDAGRKPAITWLYGSVPINVKSESRYTLTGSGSLRITSVHMLDAGVYTCRARLPGAEDKFVKARLKVLAPPSFARLPPATIKGFVQQELMLPCAVRGNPEPKVEWRKNGEKLTDNEYFQLVGSSLRIVGLLPSDSALYQCLASNSLGNIQASTSLFVQRRPTQASTPTGEPVTPPGSPVGLKLVTVGRDYVHLEWQPPGDTPPGDVTKSGKLSYDVVWKKRGHERVRQRNTTQRGLLIDRLSPNTEYEVAVYAVLRPAPGISVRSLHPTRLQARTLKPVATPLPVNGIQAESLSSREFRIRWENPLDTAKFVTHYKILIYNVSDPLARLPQNLTMRPADARPGAQTEFLVGDLHPYALYRVLVFGVNASGRGMAVEVLVRTREAKPNAPPQNVTVQVTGSRTITVRWLPPPSAQRNGEIVAYKLRYKKLNAAGQALGKAKVESLSGEKTGFSLTKLERNTPYMVKISARTAVGAGPFSPWVKFRTLATDPDGNYEDRAPGPVEGLDARGLPNAIVLSWFKPDRGRTDVTKYVIHWGEIHDDENQATLPGSRQEYTIRGLEPSRIYFVRVEPVNKHGLGAPVYKEVHTRKQPEEDTPPIPMNLRAQLTESTTAILSWEDPEGPDASLRDGRMYELRYYPTSGADRVNPSRGERPGGGVLSGPTAAGGEEAGDLAKGTISVNVTSTRARVARLRPNTKYEFKVRTIKRSSGSKRIVKSVWSFVESFQTREDKPGSPPQDLTLTPVSGEPRSVKLAWQPPLLPNGHIERYIIYFTADRKLPQSKWVQRTVKGSQLNLKLPNLDEDLHYYYQIRAVNGQGAGPFSPIRIYKTPDKSGRNGGPVPLPKEYYDLDRVPTRDLRPDSTYARGTGVGAAGEAGDGDGDDLEGGGLGDKTWWIIIGCVFSAAILLIMCVLICICWCRPTSSVFFARRRNVNGYKLGSKVPANDSVDGTLAGEPQGKVTPLPPPGLKPPDLFTHRAPAGDRQHYEMERRDSESGSDSVRYQPTAAVANGVILQGHGRQQQHVRIGSQGQPIKPKPMLLPVQDAMQPPPREPVAMVTAIGGPAGMPGMGRGMVAPPNGVMPGPTPFHRAQFAMAGPGAVVAPNATPGPRVNASEIASQPSSEELQPLMSSSQISQPGMVKPGGSPFHGSNSSKVGAVGGGGGVQGGKPLRPAPVLAEGGDSASEISRGYSTEKLNQEMANLEGLMKDLNAMTQKEFEC